MAVALVACVGGASADPGKDESGKGREREAYTWKVDGVPGLGPEGGGAPGDYWQPRAEVQAFKEEYDDGRCKVERKLEKSGEYKEETKCRVSEANAKDR